MRPLLIGQAPGPNTEPSLPLYPVPKTSAGGRLAAIMGLKRTQYLRHFDRVNLLYQFPGRHKRDDKFPVGLARAAAQAMLPLLGGRRVVLVGRNVSTAFGLGQLPYHVWDEVYCGARQFGPGRADSTVRIACVPHPSGRCRWYNSEENRLEARTFWEELLAGVVFSSVAGDDPAVDSPGG